MHRLRRLPYRGCVRTALLLLAGLLFAASASAQFQLPSPAKPAAGAPPSFGAPPAGRLPDRIILQYGYGSESKLVYLRNRDLDHRLDDDVAIATPQLSGVVVYRPTRWLDTTLELVAEREIALEEPQRIVLPSGEVLVPPKRRASLVIDQAFLRMHEVTSPFELAVGRRNYEDERHWLYDTSMDIVSVGLRLGRFRSEVWAGREAVADLDLVPNKRQVRDRIDTWIAYLDYRLEDGRVGAYTVNRNDRAGQEGHPRLFGIRTHAVPTSRLTYWAEYAVIRGHDELRRKFDGYAVDAGFTYRFTDAEWYPHFTLGYAFGSGDGRADDNVNDEFRQSGLQSNEHRFAGVSRFKVYGEALDPELSNIKILTAGLGILPAANVSVDLVFHRYRFDEYAEELRSTPITALANQYRLSKDLGAALDLIVGVRRAFGIRRLGFDFRLGWFFPGAAYRINVGDEDNIVLRRQQKAVAFVGKLWW